MKHNLKITIILIAVFFLSQIIGLLVTSSYINYNTDEGIAYGNLPMGMERPQLEESTSFIYIMLGVLLGTGIILLIVKFKRTNLWKLWYFFAVLVTMLIAFGSFMGEYLAFFLALVAGIFKVFKPNVWVHNITELFVYAGLAALFVPIINMFSAVMLLILISIYDAYAVWKSKHMVKMVKFQTKSKLFAGLSIPYSLKKTKNQTGNQSKAVSIKSGKVKKMQTAILGGGGIAFNLIFTAVVMKTLILEGMTKNIAFLNSLVVVVFVTVALAFLLFKSKRGKFYPAMPFISLGCFIGYGVLLLL